MPFFFFVSSHTVLYDIIAISSNSDFFVQSGSKNRRRPLRFWYSTVSQSSVNHASVQHSRIKKIKAVKSLPFDKFSKKLHSFLTVRCTCFSVVKINFSFSHLGDFVGPQFGV